MRHLLDNDFNYNLCHITQKKSKEKIKKFLKKKKNIS